MPDDAETSVNGLIRNTYGILMMPAFDRMSQRDLREYPSRSVSATCGDRFKCILNSNVVKRTC